MPLLIALLAAQAALAASSGAQIVALNVAPPVISTDVPASGPAAPPTPTELAGAPDQTICKTYATTGTRFLKSQCRTRAEWNQLAVDSRQATLSLQAGQNGYNSQYPGSYNGK